MNTSEKESLKADINRLIYHLNELSQREFEFEDGWENIYLNVKTVHDRFKDVVNAYILQCESLLDKINTTFWPFSFYNNLLEYLYRCSLQLRMFYPALFVPPSPNRLYFYLFLDELLNCYPQRDNMPSKIKYVMIGTGNVAHWSVQEGLVGRIRAIEDLLEPEVKQILQKVNETTISGFECDFQEPLDRQMVLAHEFTHCLVKQNPDVKEKLNAIITENENINITFIGGGHQLNQGHIEELFCDFTAIWIFGPSYAKSFIEEILFRERERTQTHPHRVVRLLIMICALPKKKKRHQYFQEFDKHLITHRDEIRLKQADVEELAKEFRKILQGLGLKKYVIPENMKPVEECIENNISYIYYKHKQDIRGLLNNLPDKSKLTEKAQRNYKDFLLESIRKNIMYRQFDLETEKLKAKLPPH